MRWLQVWDLDPLGECCCPAGSVRYRDGENALGRRGRCQRPGKHPWWVEAGGEPRGYQHGALAAGGLTEALGWGCGGNRLAAVPGDGVLVLDMDGDRAFRTFVRMAALVEVEHFLGAARTPRGYHVWLRTVVGGWTQSSALAWMRTWLGSDMGGLDLRCGDRSYVVWPGGGDGRRWMEVGEWKQVVERAYVPGRDIAADPASGMVPVWLAEGELAGFCQRKHGGGDGEIELPEGLAEAGVGGQDWAFEKLLFGCRRLAEMPEKSGRNNRLNALAYYQGAVCVWTGLDRGRVVEVLESAGRAAGTHGVAATVRSGLGSGLDRLAAQTAAVTAVTAGKAAAL